MLRRNIFLALGMTALLLASSALGAACSATGDSKNFNTGGNSGSGASHAGGSGGDSFFDAGHGGTNPGADPKTCEEAAANRTYIGCDFWPTVTPNIVWSIFDFAVVVANTGDEPSDVTVTRNGNTVKTATVPPNGLQTLYLPWVASLKGPDGDECGSFTPLGQSTKVSGGAYHLVTTKPVTVYQFNALEYQGLGGPPGKNWASCPGNQTCFQTFTAIGCFSFTNDASLLLPSTAMTGNYRIVGQSGWAEVSEGAFFSVTGTQNGTSVSVKVGPYGHVVAGGGVADTPAGGTLTFSVNAGDVVQVMGSPDGDLTGSLLKATAPVEVITGMQCTFQPFDLNFAACDHIEESVFPAETFGKHYFVTVPTGPLGNAVGHIVRLVGNIDGTTLSYPSGNQPPDAPTKIDAGEVVELGVGNLNHVNKSFEIVGDHEFAVATFMLGASLVDPNTLPPDQQGDPAQSLSTAVEQYRTKYVFLAPTDYTKSFVDIVQQTNTTVTIDGQPVNVGATAIGSGYGVARVPLGPGANGAHVLTATAPVGIQVMGYGSYTSYQYPGGLNLGTIAPPPPH